MSAPPQCPALAQWAVITGGPEAGLGWTDVPSDLSHHTKHQTRPDQGRGDSTAQISSAQCSSAHYPRQIRRQIEPPDRERERVQREGEGEREREFERERE